MISIDENISYWQTEKEKYLINLKNKIGDLQSINILLDKINIRISKLIALKNNVVIN